MHPRYYSKKKDRLSPCTMEINNLLSLSPFLPLYPYSLLRAWQEYSHDAP